MNLKHIREELKPLYVEAKKARQESYILLFCGISLFIFILINLFSSSSMLLMPLIVGTIIFVIFGFLIYNFKMSPRIKAYTNTVKEKVFPLVFKEHFDNVVFKPGEGFSKDLMSTYAVIDLGRDYSTEDLLEGEYKGVKFSRADIKTSTTTTRSNGKTTTTHTTVYFHGQVYKFDFNKNVDAYIRIREKGGFFSNVYSKGVNVFDSFSFKFEDKSFNDEFYAVSNNEQFAFYVFTPQFMEKVNRLSSLSEGHIGLVIYEESLYVACYTGKNSLEFDNTSEVDLEMVSILESDIEIIKLVVDELDLDSDLFKERS